MNNSLSVGVSTKIHILDDSGTVVRDLTNHIHPQNLARIIARCLAHEGNSSIYRVGFGNGGTVTDIVGNVTHRPPNDGQYPDVMGWRSKLYNEIYSEVVDDKSVNLGSGPGAMPLEDPASVQYLSGPGIRSVENDNTLTSTVNVECVINSMEPMGREDSFTFDEIGLFSGGKPINPTHGYQRIDINTKRSTDVSGLSNATTYNFTVSVDGNSPQLINVTTPSSGAITLATVCQLINAQLIGATVSINGYPSTSTDTYGYLVITSQSSGVGSTVVINVPSTTVFPANWLFSSLREFSGVEEPSNGSPVGFQNYPGRPDLEAERLLTHLIFDPITKPANKQYTLRYSLTVSVNRTE